MKRTLTTAAALAVLPLSLLASGSPASAASDTQEPSPTPGVLASGDTYQQNSAFQRQFGDRSAGSYLDSRTGALVTTVTKATDAQKVWAAGGTPKLVDRDRAELRSAMAALEKGAKIPGTSWGVDPRLNQVVVEADSTVSAAELARIEKIADAQDGAIEVTRVAGEFKPEVAGGDAIYGGGYRCSAAFNVKSASTRYFLTAGHCTNSAAVWSASFGGPVIGQRAGTSFPINDYGIVAYTDGSAPHGSVNLYNGRFQDITASADAVVGQAVKKSGSTTKVTSGSVTQTNVTVNYGNGRYVYGMVKTTACSAGGDSGGAHFAGTTALGIHSGSSGTCNNGVGSAVFQPVREALKAYRVWVY